MGDDQSMGVFIQSEIDSRINFAMQQNDVPVIKAVQIENRTETILRELRLRITSDPGFASPWETFIEQVPEGGVYKINAVDIMLAPGFLGGLTERVRGRFRFELLSRGETIADAIQSVDLLAHDEWGGLSSLPEILAAFVTPNHPVVEQLLRQTSELLAEWTGDPSISGYQTRNKVRQWMITCSIYGALQKLDLAYVNPPASFETEGQRVRLPDRIMENRLAACLDLSVLTAACLEQAGLHPIIVLVTGHAFVGVWMVEECFGEPAVDDLLRLRKRVDLGEIKVFDPTGTTTGRAMDFDAAVKEAHRRLARQDDFHCLIDVRRSRMSQIRPLPINQTSLPIARGVALEEQGKAQRPSLPDLSGLREDLTSKRIVKEDEAPETRMERWRRRLLDLTLRNRLLNFKSTKKTIPLLCPNLAVFEDLLAEGSVFNLRPRPKEMSPGDPRDPDSFRRRTGDDAVELVLREGLRSKMLYTDLSEKELDRRLLETYRAARMGIEEGGASALYLAIGFLLWYESPSSQLPRLAPILLLPVELHRQSVLEGFTLRLSDEEPRVNVTLLELIKQDHGIIVPGLDPLPEDESGLDVPFILRIFRENIRDIDRWDVLEVAHVGIFSFAKFLMWRDLTERADKLLENPVVEHLVNHPDRAFDPEAKFPDADRLDVEKSTLETFCPLPADASQLAAIFAAEDGRSFVLEGPPGTGKSQTIANLVAHCLARGRTVLFVSEKMAALNVVQKRLQNVGLGSYCLELHSQKSHKSKVLSQLHEALEHSEVFSPEEWEREAKLLEKMRNELNAYVQALHMRRSTGETVFQAVSMLIGLQGTPSVALSWPSLDYFDAEGLAKLRALVERLMTVAASVGDISEHPWSAVGHDDWNPAWEKQVFDVLDLAQNKLNSFQQTVSALAARLSLRDTGWSVKIIELIERLCQLLLESPGLPDTVLVCPDGDEILNRIGQWIEHGQRRDALRKEIYEQHTDKILQLDLDDLHDRFRLSSDSKWPISWFRRRSVVKVLKSVAKNRKAPDNESLMPILEKAIQLRYEEKMVADAFNEAHKLLGPFWNEGEAQWEELVRVSLWTIRFRALAKEAAGGDLQKADKFRVIWTRLAAAGRELLSPEGAIGIDLNAYRNGYVDLFNAIERLNVLLELDQSKSWELGSASGYLEKSSQTLGRWRENQASLSDWCAWQRLRKEAIRNGLEPLVASYEKGEIVAENILQSFEHSYYKWWHTELLSNDKILAHFFRPEHENKIAKFRKTDDRYIDLTRQLISFRLKEKGPNSHILTMNNSEMGILKREIGKKRRQMPVRKLLQTIPNLLFRLKPCLLMSPISIAQYLDPSFQPFDLVVFDEASQIPVWDAVGAIARGKSVVVVGDPKQLPPTSFFQRIDDDEEAIDEGLTEDLESILDECIGARLPFRSLRWHYRSRHESLIAFSNHHYYDNRLLTFASPFREGMGVQWQYIANGVYDRGKSATNHPEALSIVAEITRRLKDDKLKHYSIGVVTFSVAQQTLIEDLLEDVRIKNTDIDSFFSAETAEPVFVKNLENVQGDERDVILFSICYGPDIHGKISMNFGPMNREGGERRLNVAITRARREVIVFSSLRYDQIDLSRTRARGVHDLKNFLEYSERGPSALSDTVSFNQEADFDSPFEKAVYDALVDNGWAVHQQVGCAKYRIDLAVVDPNYPGRYLLGIECDGANYHRAKVARDRDKLRENVLHDLGWKLHRIWSTDWFKNPSREIERLQTSLEEAVAMKAEEKPLEDIRPEYDSIETTMPSNRALPLQTPSSFSNDAQIKKYQPYHTDHSNFQTDLLGRAEGFYEPYSETIIRQISTEVVCQEGPISLRLLTSRIVTYWNLKRITQKAQDRIIDTLDQDLVHVTHDKNRIFLWPAGLAPNNYHDFRVPSEDEASVREAEDLPAEEVANAVIFILRAHIGAPEDEIVKETSRLFGFKRTGRIVKERIQESLKILERQGSIRWEDDSIIINED